MIDDLDEALRDLLIRELPVTNSEIDIAFEQPKRDWSARLSRPTVNLYLHDIRENAKLRREQVPYEVARTPNSVTQQRQPFRVDLHYLITTWAMAPEDEHRLLARTLMALMRFPEFPADLLPEGLQDQPIPIPLRVGQSEMLDKPSDFWSVMDNQQRPGIVLTATLSFTAYPSVETPLTRTAEFRSRRADTPEAQGASHGYIAVRGAVLSKKPLADLRVKVLEQGTDAEIMPSGEFAIRNLQPGDYTLEITAEGHSASKHKIVVPAANYDIKLK
ncbi:MAG: Pvc16 family protein [Anaerolineales bacterium]